MAPTLLELDRVTVRRSGRPALQDVSLRIEEGESVAILGANGSGKSTLIKLIYRELYPSRNPSAAAGEEERGGTIRLRGRDRWSVQELRSTLGLVANDLQAGIPPETTSRDAVIAGFSGELAVYYDDVRTPERREAADRALEEADAAHLGHREFGTLSSGEARRVLLARALAHDPSALLLDEPTTSLDLVHAHSLVQTVRGLVRTGRSVVLVTHHFEEIFPEISRIVLLREGQVVADGPRAEVMTAPNLGHAFGASIQIEGHGPYSARVIA
jgi:iron complex transport system ATP-binding protein